MAIFTFRQDLDPVNALFRLQAELERVFQNPRGLDLGPSGFGVHPPVNIFRKGDDVVVRLEVPGFAPEDLSIESREQTLAISGKRDRKSTRLNSSHLGISYAVFCLKKTKKK